MVVVDRLLVYAGQPVDVRGLSEAAQRRLAHVVAEARLSGETLPSPTEAQVKAALSRCERVAAAIRRIGVLAVVGRTWEEAQEHTGAQEMWHLSPLNSGGIHAQWYIGVDSVGRDAFINVEDVAATVAALATVVRGDTRAVPRVLGLW